MYLASPAFQSDPLPRTLPPGMTIGDAYELQHALGEGGAAVVYSARRLEDDAEVAIKVLDPDTDDPAMMRERFFMELLLTTRVHHPNIVKIHDFGVIPGGGLPYIVMDRLHGRTMDEVLEIDGPLPVERVIPLVLGVLDALGSAHAQGVVHKDLKPNNLFLCDDRPLSDALVVLDFGIASRLSHSVGKDIEFSGTPRYLAPEYITRQELSPRVDVYQLGLVLAELLTGVPVVSAEDPQQCIEIHQQGRLALPTPGVIPAPIHRVIERAVAFEPSYRYPDARAMGHALSAPLVQRILPSAERAVVSQPVSAAAPEWWDRSFPAG